MFYTEMVDSFFYLCECGYQHNRVDDVHLVVGTSV